MMSLSDNSSSVTEFTNFSEEETNGILDIPTSAVTTLNSNEAYLHESSVSLVAPDHQFGAIPQMMSPSVSSVMGTLGTVQGRLQQKPVSSTSTPSMSSSPHSPHKTLTLCERVELIKLASNPDVKVPDLVRMFNVSHTTVYNILRKKDEVLQLWSTHGPDYKIRQRRSKDGICSGTLVNDMGSIIKKSKLSPVTSSSGVSDEHHYLTGAYNMDESDLTNFQTTPFHITTVVDAIRSIGDIECFFRDRGMDELAGLSRTLYEKASQIMEPKEDQVE